ncbi:poly-gamma-glutamate synthesis protein (capsule biosynthesis protein) [Sphingobium wenxiniae]|uniref:Poly-gamma-glutamate synthesis protein (Capsule biosynthesis protein) n=2 Tax=Sphingomonadaceae TaxID=41297 RepID=A0A562KQ33_SPHWJ|nr:poly-gamma-glutamate synthesis protein (capsule biosynthesis protein) [Sphingobium wenxiniae]
MGAGRIGWMARSRCATLAIVAVMAGLAAPAAANEREPLAITPVPSTPVAGAFTLAAVGDLIYLRPMLATMERKSPEMLRILRRADVTYGNFEEVVFDLSTFKGAPQAESGGTWMLGDPKVVDDLVSMGFDLVSTANNHATDWGVEGMLETIRRLDAAKLVNAGTGRTMSEARAPHYLDAPPGRIGLVAATSTFTPMTPASDPLGMVPGRPGANVIRTREIGLVSDADLAVLGRLAGAKPGSPVTLGERTYRATPSPQQPLTIEYEPNGKDETANLRSIRQAKQNGNFVIFSFHNHEPNEETQQPPAFTVDFARRAIDEGADAFIAHGPHQLRGIEIYKGRPIFYSLGNFAMMNNSLDHLPADMYDQFGIDPAKVTAPEFLQARGAAIFADPNLYESVIAESRFIDGQIAEIRLYPVDLGVTAKGAERGVPHLADAAVGARILERLARLSAPFGTNIAIEKGIGVIRLAARQRPSP